MPITYISSITNILLVGISILSVFELFYTRKSKNNFIRGIKLRGWLIIIFAILSIISNYYITSKAEEDKTNSEKNYLQLQLSIKDSIYKKVEESRLKITESTIKAFGEYNLQITDSFKRVINKLKLNSINPQLSLALVEKNMPQAYIKDENGRKILYFVLTSSEGISYNLSLRCYILEEQKDWVILKSDILTIGNPMVLKDSRSPKFIDITNCKFVDKTELIVFITGIFSKDPEGKYNLPFNMAFNYNFKENKFISALDMNFIGLKNSLGIK